MKPNQNMTTEQTLSDDLALQIKAGNELAFRQLYDQYLMPLFYFTNRLIDNPNESRDIVSETFTKLWELRANFSTIKNILAFLYVTSRNAGLDFLRHRKTTLGREKFSLEGVASLPDSRDDDDILHKIIHTEVISQIFDEIQKLPPQRRTVIELMYIEGLKADKVAKQLNLSIDTVRVTKLQALRQLRNQIIERKIISIFVLAFECFGKYWE